MARYSLNNYIISIFTFIFIVEFFYSLMFQNSFISKIYTDISGYFGLSSQIKSIYSSFSFTNGFLQALSIIVESLIALVYIILDTILEIVSIIILIFSVLFYIPSIMPYPISYLLEIPMILGLVLVSITSIQIVSSRINGSN